MILIKCGAKGSCNKSTPSHQCSKGGILVITLRAVIFDLGGTLIDWPDWNDDIERRWGLSYDYLITTLPGNNWPAKDEYVQAMRSTEKQHWIDVVEKQTSNTPTAILRAGFALLGREASEQELLAGLDGYGQAVSNWAIPFPDTVQTLVGLREQGYRLGLLSNTWWAAEWHN